MKSVGFIGLGVLGSAVAPHLARAGHQVLGFDIEPERLRDLQTDGIVPAGSAQDAAERSEAVITCLPSAEALHAAVSGDQGIAKAAGDGQIVIEISTLPVAEKERAREALASAGKVLLDCPMSGNRLHAQRRELTAFASGERAAVDEIEPLLRTFTREVHYLGAFGAGTTVKLCGNILNLVHNAVAAEVMVLAMKSGVDPELFHRVISGSASSSAMFESRGKMMAENRYDVEGMNFSVPLKDARIIAAHAADHRCPTPIYQAALQSYYAAVAQGHEDEDAAAVCAAMERAANLMRE
jgi:3-hydroxyisobutyrate dehydrogenase-like beta-hydroxyacid dehydrogenase